MKVIDRFGLQKWHVRDKITFIEGNLMTVIAQKMEASVYQPSFEQTMRITNLCMKISELVGSMSLSSELSTSPTLHRKLRIKSIYSSLLTEGNSLSEDEVIAVLNGKRVLGKEKDILEVQNADRAYDLIGQLDPYSLDDLLKVHGVMMDELVSHAGVFRNGNVGVFDGDRVIHMGMPARYVASNMAELFSWLSTSDMHPLLKSCIFHYEFEFIHPFEDGNGRCGRLWHTLILATWKPALAWLPVESVIVKRQQGYYDAIVAANTLGESSPFVEFMLEAVLEALTPYCLGEDPLAARERQMLNALRDDPSITVPVLAEKLGVSRSTVERTLSKLRVDGRVMRSGNRRTGEWVVAE